MANAREGRGYVGRNIVAVAQKPVLVQLHGFFILYEKTQGVRPRMTPGVIEAIQIYKAAQLDRFKPLVPEMFIAGTSRESNFPEISRPPTSLSLTDRASIGEREHLA
ncbi:hypothetical protein ACGC1H_006543 [Rhizoctonia solani]